MSWFIYPGAPLRDDELPPELVVTNRDCSITQVYVPYAGDCKMSAVKFVDAFEVFECSACNERILMGRKPKYCPYCGRRVVDA